MMVLFHKLSRLFELPMVVSGRFMLNKLLSCYWKIRFKSVGHGFFVSGGAKVLGSECIQVGNKFSSGEHLWLEAISLYHNTKYEPEIKIGDDFCCSDFVHIAAISSVEIGNSVLLGSKVHITDHSHGCYKGEYQSTPFCAPLSRVLYSAGPVRISDFVWLGDGVVVLPGVSIGEGTIVGANSVVTRDLPAGVIAVGAPAVPVKKYDLITKSWVEIN